MPLVQKSGLVEGTIMPLFYWEPGRGWNEGMAETGQAWGLGSHFQQNKENHGSAT